MQRRRPWLATRRPPQRAVSHDPLADIDWAARPSAQHGPRKIMHALAGPDPTAWEIGLTALALTGTLWVAQVSALSTWTIGQRWTAFSIAIIDGSAAVQTTTGCNKRHYHSGGHLSRSTALFIATEAMGQSCLLGFCFVDGFDSAATFCVRASLWLFMCALVLWTVPLHAQRPASVLLLLASLHAERHLLPPTPGMEWARAVLLVKYVLSHPVRHEPYRASC
jgi:hypothetical protein